MQGGVLLKFIDRKHELEALDRFYSTKGAGLLVMLGRRRVGKTRLLTHFLDKKGITGGFYWTATTHSSAFQLRDFSQALFQYDPRFTTPPASDFSFPDWEAALSHLVEIVALSSKPQVIVLDEFTYLIRNEPALTSVFQKAWDHKLSMQPNLKLILTGSLVGMMEREVLSYQAPLYGRATAMLRLRPLPYAALVELFSERTPAERVAIYAVSGGVPAYLQLFTRTNDFVSALHDHCLVPDSIVLSDPSLILHEQLREPQTYVSIISAIASGSHKWSEIARMSGVAESSLGHYLNVLQELELVDRHDPVLSNPTGRQGLYHVRDHFLRFYYRFIVPHRTAIERGYLDLAVKRINEDLRSFIGLYVFEELCREWVWAAAAMGELSFQPESVGAYWGGRRGKRVQLDVVAANQREKRLLVGEVKWGKGTVSRRVLTDLIERSQKMPQVEKGWSVEYALFARDKFSDASQTAANELGAHLIQLPEIEQMLVLANS
jgi:AAA+ ATPase superfamily predicted ATPase